MRLRRRVMHRLRSTAHCGRVNLPVEGAMQRTFFGRHYALAVVAVIFVALLAAAGLRSTPGVLMVP